MGPKPVGCQAFFGLVMYFLFYFLSTTPPPPPPPPWHLTWSMTTLDTFERSRSDQTLNSSSFRWKFGKSKYQTPKNCSFKFSTQILVQRGPKLTQSTYYFIWVVTCLFIGVGFTTEGSLFQQTRLILPQITTCHSYIDRDPLESHIKSTFLALVKVK